MALYSARRRRNALAMGLSVAAAALGLGWLGLILGALLWEGVGAVSPQVFTEMTPPPGGACVLLNAIVVSLMMTTLSGLAGMPLCILAGTYMAEYGRHGK